MEVRTAENPIHVAPALRKLIQQVDPSLHVARVTLQSTHTGETILRERMLAPELPLPVGGEDQDPGVVQLARHEVEQKERGLVGPVDVVEDQDHRASLGGGAKELCHAAEEAERACSGWTEG